jgi:NADH dehydrogenase (ubiquinone) 1 alpha subcomplex subunit 8
MTGCMVDLLKDLKKKCPDELNAYASCLDYRSNNLDKCRAAQEAFESKCPL